jgi:hypothetical protein
MLKRNIVVLTIATVVLGAGSYAWAQGAPERPTTTAAGGAATGEDRPAAEGQRRRAHGGLHRAGGLGRRAVHGELIVRTKDGFATVTFDRGEVLRHGATSITIERPDGVEVTKSIDGDTRFRGIGSADEIVDGRPALVVSKGDVAVLVAQRPGDEGPRPRGPS